MAAHPSNTLPLFAAPGVARELIASILPFPTREARPETRRFGLEALAGRLVELCPNANGASAALNASASLILEAQLRGEPSAWITAGESAFYAPDFHEVGIDLRALPVVRAPDVRAATRAADRLLRSGAFALVVLDFASLPHADVPLPAQTRLVGLAHRHHATLVFLTPAQERSTRQLASLVSLRAEGSIAREGFDRFQWTLRILKDKCQGPGWSHAEVCRGPDGLC